MADTTVPVWHAAAEIIAIQLGHASGIVVNGGGIVRRGYKRIAARGGKGVLVSQRKAIGESPAGAERKNQHEKFEQVLHYPKIIVLCLVEWAWPVV